MGSKRLKFGARELRVMQVGQLELAPPKDAVSIRGAITLLRPKVFRTKLSHDKKYLHVQRLA